MAYILAQAKKEQNEGSGKMYVLQIFIIILIWKSKTQEKSALHCFGKTEKVDCSFALGEGDGTLLMTLLVVRLNSVAFDGRNSKG